MEPTRREVLHRAGWVVAAAAFPSVTGAAATSPPETAAQAPTSSPDHAIGDVMARLSTYMSQARDRALTDHVLEQTRWHVLDTLAAMVSGSELAPGQAAIRFARVYGGKEVATVVGDTVVCGPIEAALANGVLAHADETDDSWPGGWHPGCNVVPAALAAGEQFGISGAHFLRAVALGYDVGARMLITLRPGLADSHKATHAIAGVFGAAAAAGCAASLNAQQMRWLLDYTAQQCSGIGYWYRDTDHIEKGFVFGGMPARSGVTSALLVHTGWSEHWSTPAYFENHSFLTAAAAEMLRDRGAVLVGIDSHNIDDTRSRNSRPVHSTLLREEILIVEHLRGLEQLPQSGFTFSAVPPKFKGVGTFPVRAYARITS